MNDIKIIENTKEAMKEYGHCWGSEVVKLSKKQIKELLKGKCIAFNDGEYTTFLVLGDDVK